MGNSYGMLDMTVYGRQEPWENSPEGWPRRDGTFRHNGSRPRSGPASQLAVPTISAPPGAEQMPEKPGSAAHNHAYTLTEK